MEEADVKAAIDSVAGITGADYPKIMTRLLKAGLDDYRVDVAKGTVTYRGGGASYTEHSDSIESSSRRGSFNDVAIADAFARISAEAIDYPGFLRRLWAAGVTHYEVDLSARTLTFMGEGNESYVHHVQEADA